MTETCQICGLSNPENAHYHKIHRMSQEIYFHRFWPRFDLQTKEPIVFKSQEQYLHDDFNNKNNLKAYLGSLTDESAYSYIVGLLKKRKELKNLVYLPGQFELRSILIPPTTYIIKRYGINKFNEMIKEVNLVNRYDYQSKLVFIDKKLDIIQDTREANPIRFNKDKVNIEVKKLNQGDYTVKNNPYNVIIERKGVSDFCGTLSITGFDRFSRELERVVENKEYLIIVIEGKFTDLQSYNHISHYKHIRAHPNYIMQKARALSQKYAENCQFVAANGRIGCKNLVEKVFSLEDGINPRNIDWEFMINIKRIEI